MKSFIFIAKIALLTTFLTSHAHAYLDPGTGSMLLQGLIAGLMVVATTMGIYWQRFLDFVYRVTGKDFRKTSGLDEEPKDEGPKDQARKNES